MVCKRQIEMRIRAIGPNNRVSLSLNVAHLRFTQMRRNHNVLQLNGTKDLNFGAHFHWCIFDVAYDDEMAFFQMARDKQRYKHDVGCSYLVASSVDVQHRKMHRMNYLAFHMEENDFCKFFLFLL